MNIYHFMDKGEVPKEKEPMSDQPNKNDSVKKESTSDIDRYERLQQAAETQLGRVVASYDRHTELIKRFVTVGGGIIAVVLYFTYRDYRDFKAEIRDGMQSELQNATNRLENTLLGITNTASIQARNASQGELDKIFKDDTHLQKNIEAIMSSMVDKRLSEFRNRIEEAELQLRDTTNAADISLTIIRAQNDDRYAFDKLVQMRETESNQYKQAVIESVNSISQNLEIVDTGNTTKGLIWDTLHFNPTNASIQEYNKILNSTAVGGLIAKPLILMTLAQQTRIPPEDRNELYRSIMDNNGSLQLVWTACRIINYDAHLDLNILGLPIYQKWAESNWAVVVISNCNAVLATNATNVSAYDLRGEAFSITNNFTNAINDYENAVRLNTTNVWTYNSLAWLLATCPTPSLRDGNRAVSLAKKACDQTQSNGWYTLGTLAAAYAEIGDFEKAVEFQKKSLSLGGMTDKERAEGEMYLSLYETKTPFHEQLKH